MLPLKESPCSLIKFQSKNKTVNTLAANLCGVRLIKITQFISKHFILFTDIYILYIYIDKYSVFALIINYIIYVERNQFDFVPTLVWFFKQIAFFV